MRDSNKTGMVNPYLVLPWKRMTKTEGDLESERRKQTGRVRSLCFRFVNVAVRQVATVSAVFQVILL